jgi:predicted 3-demethylubiquinone-9 3-methyltransferase (glyoxalase superfamily)
MGSIQRYSAGQEPDKEGTVMFADFMLLGQWLAAMDSARMHDFTFNEAISFIVNCDNQEEIDYYWDKLSAVPEAEQCGWLKDRYGLSWQVAPTAMDEMMQSGTREQIARVTQAFLKMKKFDLAELKKAYEGK